MKRIRFASLFLLIPILLGFTQDSSIRVDFSGATADANKVTLMGAGFGAYPQADVTFGAIPADNAFENATDGTGMIVQADPGEGVMVLTQPIQTTTCALIRCSVRASASHASVYLASVDQGVNTFVSTITPTNSELFVNKYKRLADFFLPPSTGFQAIIQVTNASTTEKLTVYLDNLEILILDKDNINLAVNEITGEKTTITATSTPVLPISTVTPVSIPTPTPTHTPIPTNTSIPGSPGETLTISLPLPEGAKPLEMVLIHAGTFTMGSPESEKNRFTSETQHPVTLTNDFYLGHYEVTQAQWEAVMGSNPTTSYGVGPNYPVHHISWEDCQSFVGKLNQLGQGTFRLPTEAEWEYACRAGTTTAFYWGDDADYSQIGQYAWYISNSVNADYTSSNPGEVGGKLPNGWGLFDMSGNVLEWCQDRYGNYSSSAQTDPLVSNSGKYCMLRGGGWTFSAKDCRSANRSSDLAGAASHPYGLRLQRSVENNTKDPSTPTPVSPNETVTIDLSLPADAKPLEMVLIPAGVFSMGTVKSEYSTYDPMNGTTYIYNATPPHQAILTKKFYLSKYEITQAQWKAVMGADPYDLGKDPAYTFDIGSNYPIYWVSWDDCQNFIDKLNQLGQGTFGLPTEAEWEYACRAGTATTYYWGDDLDSGGRYAWSGDIAEVGQKLPNAWGLYDMIGNVMEWCHDWYGNYDSGVQTDPMGPSAGIYRVLRGSSSTYRDKDFYGVRRDNHGFRIQRSYENGVPTRVTPTPTNTMTSGVNETITITLSLSEGAKPLEMVRIPTGTFVMGSTDDEQERLDNEGPQHQVTLTKDFYMGKYEITQAQWQAVVGSKVANWTGDNEPVQEITWNDCQMFIQKLNQLGRGKFRLPTEAEWEYACRAGTTTAFYWGDDNGYGVIRDYAWHTFNSDAETHEVGVKLPNAWGLYDMIGNAPEWCFDQYEGYRSGSQIDPVGELADQWTEIEDPFRVGRGGSYYEHPIYCRSASRLCVKADDTGARMGFRIRREYP